MVNECGITLYFRNDRIHIRKRTVEVLNHPAYVQLFINEGKKQLFIQSSTKNKDAFRVYYKPESKKKASKETGNTVPTDNQAGSQESQGKICADNLIYEDNSSTIKYKNISANPTTNAFEKDMNGQYVRALTQRAEENPDDEEMETVIRPERFYVNAKSLLDYLAKVIGVSRQSDSLRYVGELLPDGETVYIDLTRYEVIPHENIMQENIQQEKMTQGTMIPGTMVQEKIPHDGAAASASQMPTEGQEHEQRSI